MRRLLVLLVISACLLTAADISGTWNMAVETEMGSGNPVFVLKQDGEKLTGNYRGALGEAPVTGTVKGTEVIIEFSVEQLEGKIRYTGELDASGRKMKGKIQFGSLGQGSFTGEKAGS